MTSSMWQLHEDVCFGRSGGKIIWQPRIGCWFTDKRFAGEELPEPYEGMELDDIFRALGVSNRLYGHYNPCFRRVEHPAVEVTQRPLNDMETEITIRTPAGVQRAVQRRSLNNRGTIHVKREVASEEELRVLTWREENSTWEWDQEQFDRAVREVGDLGAPTMYLPRMNIQCLYIEKMGVEPAIYALYDFPDTAEAFFRARDENHDRLVDVIAQSPIHIINYGENVHSGTLPPELFLKYHLPACQHRSQRLRAAGKFTCSHWDGDCRPLLPYVHDTGLDGIEAITPQPQGDVTLEETREALGDDMFLIDGIPAIYFDDTFPLEVLEDCVDRLIDLFAPRLVLGISDELSSTGDIERIRRVKEMVDEYNAQFD
ncbi:hypothetical protein ACFL6X_04285 [Candidatus Latescibacterota bacterium]